LCLTRIMPPPSIRLARSQIALSVMLQSLHHLSHKKSVKG